MNKQGYLYILTNVSIPGKVKIGRTERNPEDRRKEISSATGVPTPFNLIHSAFFEDCHYAEKKLHERLFQEGKRTTKNKEFFDIEVDHAIRVVNELEKELNNNKRENTNEIIGLGIKLLYGDAETLKNEKRALEYFERAAFLESVAGSYWSGICCEVIANKIRKKDDKKSWQQRALNHYRVAMSKNYLKAFAKASWIYRRFEQKNEADSSWNTFLEEVNKANKIDKETAKWLNKWIGQQIEWGYKKNITKKLDVKKHKDFLLQHLDKYNDPKGFVKSYLKAGFMSYFLYIIIAIALFSAYILFIKK